MGICYYSHGEPTQQKIFVSETPDLHKLTLVYFKSAMEGGGWGCDTVSEMAAEIIIDSGIYIDRDTGFLRAYPPELKYKLLKVHQNCTLEILATEDKLTTFLHESQQFELLQKKNALRRRYGRSVEGNLKPPEVFSLYDRNADLINVNGWQLDDLGIEMLVKWKYSTFSLHCYAISQSVDIIFDLLAKLSKVQGLQIVQCKDDSLIPVA